MLSMTYLTYLTWPWTFSVQEDLLARERAGPSQGDVFLSSLTLLHDAIQRYIIVHFSFLYPISACCAQDIRQVDGESCGQDRGQAGRHQGGREEVQVCQEGVQERRQPDREGQPREGQEGHREADGAAGETRDPEDRQG